MNRRFGGKALVAAALVGAATWAAPAAAAPVPCRSAATAHLRGDLRETIRLRTFHVVAEPLAESFPVGTAAKIRITVTRPAHEDPAGLGVELEPPPASSPRRT
jgi:hypothetical protein